jgi:cold-inducible RNA-binding protein
MNSKLYVGNLSNETTETDLATHFSQAGKVSRADLKQVESNGQLRCFAFVTMSNEDEVQKAISLFDGHEFMRRTLSVTEARSRADTTGGGPRRNIRGPQTTDVYRRGEAPRQPGNPT